MPTLVYRISRFLCRLLKEVAAEAHGRVIFLYLRKRLT
jgi:hypothetical protein